MRRFAMALVTTLAVATALVPLAAAGNGVKVSGTYTVPIFGSTTCSAVGSSGFMYRCETTGLVSAYEGDLVGNAVADFTSLVNCKTLRETGHGTETFTSTEVGVVGTLSWIDQFSADVDCSFAPYFFIPIHLDINSVAVKGTGAFADVQGRLTFTDTTYSGTLH